MLSWWCLSRANMASQAPQPQPQPQGYHQHHHHQPSSIEEVRTLWIGDLQYWVDENYLTHCFAHTGEVTTPHYPPHHSFINHHFTTNPQNKIQTFFWVFAFTGSFDQNHSQQVNRATRGLWFHRVRFSRCS